LQNEKAGFALPIYGQSTGPNGYDLIDSPIFAYWMPVLKVVGDVVQVALEDAERVVEDMLPIQRD
jgi:hypothetical protein